MLQVYDFVSCVYAKATFFGNRAACYQAMGEIELVVEDCTDSLDYRPAYVKVLNRRCQAFETLKKYDEALTGNLISDTSGTKLSDTKLVYSILSSYDCSGFV
jgi:hypothetical protein